MSECKNTSVLVKSIATGTFAPNIVQNFTAVHVTVSENN